MYASHVRKANECAQLAMAMISDLGMAADPGNYALWYNYFAREHPQLNQAIDGLLNSDGFTEAEGAKLRVRFLGEAGCAPSLIDDLADKLQTEMATALALISEAGSSSASYSDNLQQAGGAIHKAARNSNLAEVVGRLIEETQIALERSRSIETKLSVTAQEVEQLRQDLQASRREGSLDGLTGLTNRKTFDVLLREATVEARTAGKPLSLLFADIDHFKRFNDTHGHAVGDQVIKLFANILKDNVKGKDVAARFGGEEFIVILPTTPITGAATVGESIRKSLSEHSLVLKKSNTNLGRITVSVGVAQYADGETADDLVKRADEALYRAKQGGRDRVVCAADPVVALTVS